MSIARINGIDMYHEVHGKGYPLVLAHGFVGTTRCWEPQVATLSKRCKLTIYDARGHGKTEAPVSPSEYSQEIVVEDLRQLLGYLKIQEAVIGGLSMGAFLAMDFYLHHPAMVTALILCDGGPGVRNPGRLQQWNNERAIIADLLEKDGIVAFADSEWAALDYYTPRDIMITMSAVGLANYCRGVLTLHDTRVIDRIGEIAVPTLIVCGSEDKPFLAAADYMNKAIPHSEKVIISGAGHAANMDNALAFDTAVTGFLAGLGLSRGSAPGS